MTMSSRRAAVWFLAAAVLLAGGTAAGAGKAPRLTKKHSGWRQTQCESCHDATSMAKTHADAASLRAPACGRCHGYNGAPHEAHAVPINPCANCHGTVGHLKVFKAPEDCIFCHNQAPSGPGR
jgi:NAD-dependent SIR2 family protein deacetylase